MDRLAADVAEVENSGWKIPNPAERKALKKLPRSQSYPDW